MSAGAAICYGVKVNLSTLPFTPEGLDEWWSDYGESKVDQQIEVEPEPGCLDRVRLFKMWTAENPLPITLIPTGAGLTWILAVSVWKSAPADPLPLNDMAYFRLPGLQSDLRKAVEAFCREHEIKTSGNTQWWLVG